MTKEFGGSSWGSPSEIEDGSFQASYSYDTATSTEDGDIHLVYGNSSDGLAHKVYDGSSWTSAVDINGIRTSEVTHVVKAVSNDLYVFWIDASSPYEINYRQYDADPLTPTNFQISGGIGQHPRITWDPNKEPDLAGYDVWTKYEPAGWVYETTVSGDSTGWTDTEITIGAGGKFVSDTCYRIYAVDAGDNESLPTVQRCKPIGGIEKRALGDGCECPPDTYELGLAYPNPFNPSTSISYALPEASIVTLQVFDLSGRVVAGFEKTNMGPGYSVFTVNGSELSSGLYLYRFTAMSTESKRSYRGFGRVMLLK